MPDSINDMYIADEPVEIRYEYNWKTYLKKADKGDDIYRFILEVIMIELQL